MVKKCKVKYRKKCFATKKAKNKYKSWDPIIRKAKTDKVPKSTMKMMRSFQKSWIGK